MEYNKNFPIEIIKGNNEKKKENNFFIFSKLNLFKSKINYFGSAIRNIQIFMLKLFILI
jgi:hypothetical protein